MVDVDVSPRTVHQASYHVVGRSAG